MTGRSRHAYDHRIKGQILRTGNSTTLKKLVDFYGTEHNERMPHSAFDGQTQDEMYFGRGARVPEELAARRQEARRQRLEHNRRQACDHCPRYPRRTWSHQAYAAFEQEFRKRNCITPASKCSAP